MVTTKQVSIGDAFQQTKTKARVKAMLDVLWMQPDHEVRDPSGFATKKLYDLMPIEVMTGKNSELVGMPSFSTIMRDIDDAGFIIREVNGKKCYAIRFGHRPTDWQEPADVVIVEVDAQSNGQHITSDELPPDDADDDEVYNVDQEAKEGGIRPGRLAARLERMEEGFQRTIPALVEEGVVAGINGWFTQLAVALGFMPESSEAVEEKDAAIDELVRRLAATDQELTVVREELTQERVSNIAAREELNGVLRRTVSTQETSPLRPSDLQEAYRGLARWAIKHGWTLHRAGSGHILWKSPTGYRYFTGSTSSDWRAVKNSRSDMERLGSLPKE